MKDGVLIETLWNVNTPHTTEVQYPSSVLIETLWNVNVNICENLRTEIRINRNIVECKLYSRSCRCSCILVLIETLWNVNIENYDRTEEWSDRINRNIVECKSEYVPAVST